MARGYLITLEGPEKSGKSTQSKLLAQYLKQKGRKVCFVREPGSTLIGEKLRRLILDTEHAGMSLWTEALLYMAARAQLLEEVIRPALKNGFIVLCDRFTDSTIAYQGFGCGLPVKAIGTIGMHATAGIEPDLTLLLDFWASTRQRKSGARKDRIEGRSDAFHRRVKAGYFALARRYPRRIKVIKVCEDKRQTHLKIREVVDACLFRT